MKIVTGGAGFIGSNIVKQLNNRGINDILIVDDLTDGRKCRNLQGLDFYDYMDYEDFDDQMADDTFDCGYIDVVFHEGACSDTMNYDGRYMMKTIMKGVRTSFAIACSGKSHSSMLRQLRRMAVAAMDSEKIRRVKKPSIPMRIQTSIRPLCPSRHGPC